MTSDEKKNQPIKTHPDLTQVLELADKDIKTALITISYIFKNRWRHWRYKKTQILEVKFTVYEMKNALD